MRVHFDSLLQQLETPIIVNCPFGQFDVEARIYMSYWYAGLYVVVEGWQALKLSDLMIDGLLSSNNVDLLKRYRHGTFHFQKKYNDDRFLKLIDEGFDVVEWIRSLNTEFGRWFLNWIATNSDSLSEMRTPTVEGSHSEKSD